MPAVTWRELAATKGPFRRLWLGDAVSLFGDWFTYVAVGVLALGPDESGTDLLPVAVVLLAHSAPLAVVGPIAGRFADRYDRRTIMVVASLMRAVAVVGMIVAASAGSLGWVSALLFIRMGFGAFVEPAASAALPQLVARASISRANALLSATWSVVFAIGVAVGGLFTAAFGPVWALVVDGCTFVLAAMILGSLPRLHPGTHTDAARDPETTSPVVLHVDTYKSGGETSTVAPESGTQALDSGLVREAEGLPARGFSRRDASLADFVEVGPDSPTQAAIHEAQLRQTLVGEAEALGPGLRPAIGFALRHRNILHAALGKVPVSLANGGGWVLLHYAAAVVGSSFGGAALALGAFHSARAVGTGIGPILWARSHRLGGSALGIHVSTGLTLLTVIAFTLTSTPWIALVVCVLWGLASGANWVTSVTRTQVLTPNRALGRIASIDLVGHAVSQGIGGLVGALVADALQTPELSGVVGVAIGLVAWLSLAYVCRGQGSEVRACAG